MNAMAQNPVIGTVEESIARGHDAANRARYVIEGMLSDLTGDGGPQNTVGIAPMVPGLIYSADELAAKLAVIVDQLEHIRGRISSPKVVSMAQGLTSGSRIGSGNYGQAG